MDNIVQLLKPHVSTFSAAVPLKYKHSDEVVVGGKIVGILNLHDLLKDSPNPEDHSEGVYLTLDDGVGLNEVVILSQAYELYLKEFQLAEGMIVIAKGKIDEVDTTHTYKNKRGKTNTVDNHEDPTIRVLAWQVRPLLVKVDKVKEPGVS